MYELPLVDEEGVKQVLSLIADFDLTLALSGSVL